VTLPVIDDWASSHATIVCELSGLVWMAMKTFDLHQVVPD